MIRATIEGLTEEEEKILIKSLDKLNNFFKEKYNLNKVNKEKNDE